MFGFSEILVFFILGLVVLGPKKLPGVAVQVGRWLGRARAMARQFREQLEQEVNSVNLEAPPARRPGAAAPPNSEPAAPTSQAPPAPPVDSTTGHHDWANGPPPEALAASAMPAPEPAAEPAAEFAHETVHPETQVYAPSAPAAAPTEPVRPESPSNGAAGAATARPTESRAPVERGEGAHEPKP
jgi:sec-independent protein translocase protein TatB